MESTISDFWTMIWEKKCHTIVMLSQLEENGEVQLMLVNSQVYILVIALLGGLFKYWPDEDETSKLGKFSVKTTAELIWGLGLIKHVFKVKGSYTVCLVAMVELHILMTWQCSIYRMRLET